MDKVNGNFTLLFKNPFGKSTLDKASTEKENHKGH